MHKVEAEKKYCPIYDGYCLTSNCMMWKFNTVYDNNVYTMRGLPLPPKPVGIHPTDGDCTLKRS